MLTMYDLYQIMHPVRLPISRPLGGSMSHPLFEKHHELLAHSLEAIAKRGYWSPFPENPNPRAYGDGAAEAGNAMFEARLERCFALGQPGTTTSVGQEG